MTALMPQPGPDWKPTPAGTVITIDLTIKETTETFIQLLREAIKAHKRPDPEGEPT